MTTSWQSILQASPLRPLAIVQTLLFCQCRAYGRSLMSVVIVTDLLFNNTAIVLLNIARDTWDNRNNHLHVELGLCCTLICNLKLNTSEHNQWLCIRRLFHWWQSVEMLYLATPYITKNGPAVDRMDPSSTPNWPCTMPTECWNKRL